MVKSVSQLLKQASICYTEHFSTLLKHLPVPKCLLYTYNIIPGSKALNIVSTVEPMNKGHFGDNIKSAVVSFVERLSSLRRFKMY